MAFTSSSCPRNLSMQSKQWRLFTFLLEGFAPYATLIFHSALKTTFSWNPTMWTLKKIKKTAQNFWIPAGKGHGRRKRLRFNQFFLKKKKDRKLSISRPNNSLQNFIFPLFYDSIKNAEAPVKKIAIFPPAIWIFAFS